MKQGNPIEFLGYLIAAALLIPLGIWLKANYAEDVGYQILSLGGLLY
ncbi:hypothetical protein ACFSE0_07585 [Ochrobactrum teleogrylli]|nr:hypothetical protein [[Ochrobactrum] teleogrylli]